MLKRFLALALLAFASITAQAAGTCCSTFSILSDTTRQWSSSVLLPPTYTDALVLAANVSATQAVPKNAAGAAATWVVFSANCNFFALTGASASVPGATTTDGSASMQNPSAWNISNSVTQITVIAPTTCTVTLSFYQ